MNKQLIVFLVKTDLIIAHPLYVARQIEVAKVIVYGLHDLCRSLQRATQQCEQSPQGGALKIGQGDTQV